MELFDDINRDYDGPALYTEPDFPFLNRSARPWAAKVRILLEGWFSRYPRADQRDLRSRFRTASNVHHRSAFFELFLHEILVHNDYIVTVHPTMADFPTHPDFLVRSSEGASFYLEAVLANDEPDSSSAAKARMNTVYDGINSLDSPDYFIGMKMRGAPRTTPSSRHIRKFLQDRLNKLNLDEIRAIYESGRLRDCPEWRYEYEDWQIDFFPIPKSENSRNRDDVRNIGIQIPQFQPMNVSRAIRESITSKAGKYGNMELPYVVAVNAFSIGSIDQIDIIDALFGTEVFTISQNLSGNDVALPSRKRDGVWTSNAGPRYTRLSGVLLASSLHPWNIPNAEFRLYHNPWAQKPLVGPLNDLHTAKVIDDRLSYDDGKSICELLGLQSDWPSA